MERPLVIAHHLIWTGYEWWLPNDPRGSMSQTIASDVIKELGDLHYGRKRIQPTGGVVRDFYKHAREVLKFPSMTFGPRDFNEIAAGFAEAIAVHRYTCYACALMPDHVHILIRKHKHPAEEIIANLQHSSRLRLSKINLCPPDHPIWTSGIGWKAFLDRPSEVRRVIKYIEDNPIKARLSRQCWPFVKDYDNWPLHPGHSPNSPYARRLRDEGEC